MKIFETIINLIKKAGSVIIEFFKSNKLADIANDTTTTIAGIATSALAVAAGYNIVKNLIQDLKSDSASNKKRDKKAADELARDNIRAGSADDKIRNLKSANKTMTRGSSLSEDDLALLVEVSKTRNSFFKVLSPEEKMKLLKMENFDFEAARKKMEEEDKSYLFGLIHRKGRRIGAPTTDSPFRKPVDYGWLNFIARPLDDFLCWWFEDPTPKYCKQVKLVDSSEIPDIPFESINDVLGSVSSYMSFNNEIATDAVLTEDISVDEVFSQELFRSKKFKDTRRRVNQRMINNQEGLSKTIFSLMDDEIRSEKKKKKDKKKKKKEKGTTLIHYSGDKKKSKKDKEYDSKADKYAEEYINYHINMAMKGQEAFKGFRK